MSYRKLTKRMEGALPLVAGVVVGEAIDASGIIDTTIAPIAGTWTPLAKGIIGLGITAAGLGMKKGAMADIVLGAGLPIAASGIVQQFFPGGIIPPPTAVLPAPAGLAPVQLTSYARPTGLRYGHPTLRVTMIPPRPGILAPSAIPQSLAGKFMLGTGR